MTESRIRISMSEASREDLDDLAAYLASHAPAGVRVIPLKDEEETVREEPITIGIALVTLGAVATRGAAKVISTWLEQKGKTERARLDASLRLTLDGTDVGLETLLRETN